MKTKVVYSIISTENDYYFEKALLSAASLRKHNPDVYIVLVTDNETKSNIRGRSMVNIDEYFSEICSVDIPERFSTPLLRSRYLKTTMRSHVEGTYLFMDVDTLVCGSLSALDDLDADLAAVEEARLPVNTLGTMYAKQVGLLDLFIGKPYYNSGIVYSRDTEISKAFYQEWHNQYCKYAFGSYEMKRDQTTFCLSNINMNFPFKKLSESYNYLLWKGVRETDIKRALILHYFNKNRILIAPIVNNSIFKSVRDEGLQGELVRCVINFPRIMLAPVDKGVHYWEFDRYHWLYKNNKKLYSVLRFVSKVLCRISGYSQKIPMV